MGKQQYLNLLRQSLAGLPADVVARTLAYYEQRFIDGLAAGRSEQEITDDLGEPGKIAKTLRANIGRRPPGSCADPAPAVAIQSAPASVIRMLLTSIGLAVFNLFMVIPAAVFAALLAALYAIALALYLSGIVVTATGLAGVNEVVLTGPPSHIHHGERKEDFGATRVAISEDGIQVFKERKDVSTDRSRVIRHEDTVAGRGIQVYTDMDEDARTTQSLVGMSMVLAAIVALLLGLSMTNYAFMGARRYIQMNMSLIKGQ